MPPSNNFTFDASDRHRQILENQLAQIQKLESIGRLAAGIAHEINTPTQYLGDNARFLQDAFYQLKPLLTCCLHLGSQSKSEAADLVSLRKIFQGLPQDEIEYLLREIPAAIEQSLEGIRSISKIVRSLKDFSHPGNAEKQAVDLNQALETTLTVSRNAWKYVAELHLELAPDLPPAPCRPGDLNQAFLNLIVNAADALEAKLGRNPREKGTLTIRTRREGDDAVIEVQDTGTGIPENIHNSIFDPFFTTKKVGRGTGQGLAIARRIIVQRHAGTLSFQSAVGRGTTFTIRIPLHPNPPSGQQEDRHSCLSPQQEDGHSCQSLPPDKNVPPPPRTILHPPGLTAAKTPWPSGYTFSPEEKGGARETSYPVGR
jgi:signal transduction histidine kinase